MTEKLNLICDKCLKEIIEDKYKHSFWNGSKRYDFCFDCFNKFVEWLNKL